MQKNRTTKQQKNNNINLRDIELVNEIFNDEIDLMINDDLEEYHVFKLGYSKALLDLNIIHPIELSRKVLYEKHKNRSHNFPLNAIKNLPLALNKPIAILESATEIGKSIVVITELKLDSENFIVAIKVDARVKDITIEDIRSLYPKSGINYLYNWIKDLDLLRWVDKKKINELISRNRSNYDKATYKFVDIANVVKSFNNWTTPFKKNANSTKNQSDSQIGSVKRGGRFTSETNSYAFNDHTQDNTLIFYYLKDFTQYKREHKLHLIESSPRWTLTDNNGNDFEWENQKSYETNSWDHSRRYERIKKENKSKLSLLKLKALSEIEIMEIELQMQESIVTTIQPQFKKTPFEQRTAFINRICTDFQDLAVHNKSSFEKLARTYGIDSQNEAKELVELAIVLEARRIIELEEKPFPHLVDLYKLQPNLSHRTTTSMDRAQYSTPCPISYLAGLYVKSNNEYTAYYEPTAGNGLLTIALPYSSLFVNELDPIRLDHLERQPFTSINNEDATKFTPNIKFDGIITNPPFGKIDSHTSEYELDNYKIIGLEHYIAIKALKTMKDDGKASIIVGGHTKYDTKETKGKFYVKGGKDRYFLNYLYHFYNVEDIIPIDGHALYSRQGTAFDTRLILINGRKKEPKGFGYKTTEALEEVVTDFYELEKRVMKLL